RFLPYAITFWPDVGSIALYISYYPIVFFEWIFMITQSYWVDPDQPFSDRVYGPRAYCLVILLGKLRISLPPDQKSSVLPHLDTSLQFDGTIVPSSHDTGCRLARRIGGVVRRRTCGGRCMTAASLRILLMPDQGPQESSDWPS